MARTQMDLVNEMKATHEAAQAETSAPVNTSIAVGFEDHTEWVHDHEDAADSVVELTQLMQRGGEPIGIIQLIGGHKGDHGRCRCRVFAEYADEEWVEEYLFSLQADSLRSLAAQGRIDPDSIQLDA